VTIRVRQRAFGLVEATIATVIAGGVIVVSVNAIASAVVIKHKTADRERGRLLAADLMSEILRYPYADPVNGPSLGPGVDEITGDRSLFDDVDDYHGWTASPPEEKDGTPMADLSAWGRSVTVTRLNPGSMTPSVTDTGLVQVTVVVQRNGAEVARVVALRTDTWPIEGSP
jgi:hypothetical protein